MPASFSVESSTGSYDVSVGIGYFSEFPPDLHIIADSFFKSHLEEAIFIGATEHAKSLDQAPALIEALRSRGVNRSATLVAGGGILQDIASFAASIYMRGVPWSYFPTTVLAMVDSCIGGKSSINVGPYKNLVGTFHPPQHIYIDPALAETLPRDQFASGLIEAAKITYVRSPEAFAAHLACGPSITMPTANLEALILNSLLAKKHFIEIDEFDKKERLLLNFGHTFGHALEGASHYAIPHGIAVGLGILCSLAFQRDRGIQPQVSKLEQHLDQLIRTLPDLAAILESLSLDDILNRFASDKKHTTTHYTLILINLSGEVVLEQIPRSSALESALRNAIASTIALFAS
jgi:3-dehydroquinate synthase